MSATIFVTDDKAASRAAIVKGLAKKQHRARGFDSGEALLEALDHDTPDLILLDLKMPGTGGLEVLKRLQQISFRIPVIMLTSYGTVQDAVEAMKLGAYDFLIKTIDLDAVEPVIERALELLSLRRRVALEMEHEGGQYALSNLVAHSAAMQKLLTQVRDVAENPKATVLLMGETGTGKEFIARVLHHNSIRASGSFVGVNCTAVPRDLFESEFFGYERGAFTGANQRKLGLLEKAEGGTLFLDEIGDLDFSMQVKLLRVLQERSFRRLGGMEDIEVDFRLIAATNRDLKKEVARGAFREDLFFRLNVIAFELPPLRQRTEDIIPLCMRALVRYGKEFCKDVLTLEPETRTILERYTYPCNIRELQNIIERALIFCHGHTLTADCLPSELRERPSRMAAAVTQGQELIVRLDMTLGKRSLADVESAIIEEVLRLDGHNKTLAAKHLGLTRFALDRRLRKITELDA